MDTALLNQALDALLDRLEARDIGGRIYVIGGAALALAYYQLGERRLTTDVDAWLTPNEAILAEAREVAVVLGLPPDWLNEKATVFVPVHGLPDGIPVRRRARMVVEVAPPRLLLAMKLRAGRVARDADDIAVLLRRCDIKTIEEARQVLDDVYEGEEPFTSKAQAIVEAALGEYTVTTAIPPFTLAAVDASGSTP